MVGIGSGTCLISFAAVRGQATKEFKVNAWLNVRIILGGDRAEALTQLPASVAESCTSPTAGFIQTASTPSMVDGVDAVPTCAAALLAIPRDIDLPEDQVFRLNRVTFTTPVAVDQIATKTGDQLYVQVALHDWTGSARQVPVCMIAHQQMKSCKKVKVATSK